MLICAFPGCGQCLDFWILFNYFFYEGLHFPFLDVIRGGGKHWYSIVLWLCWLWWQVSIFYLNINNERIFLLILSVWGDTPLTLQFRIFECDTPSTSPTVSSCPATRQVQSGLYCIRWSYSPPPRPPLPSEWRANYATSREPANMGFGRTGARTPVLACNCSELMPAISDNSPARHEAENAKTSCCSFLTVAKVLDRDPEGWWFKPQYSQNKNIITSRVMISVWVMPAVFLHL